MKMACKGREAKKGRHGGKRRVDNRARVGNRDSAKGERPTNERTKMREGVGEVGGRERGRDSRGNRAPMERKGV